MLTRRQFFLGSLAAGVGVVAEVLGQPESCVCRNPAFAVDNLIDPSA